MRLPTPTRHGRQALILGVALAGWLAAPPAWPAEATAAGDEGEDEAPGFMDRTAECDTDALDDTLVELTRAGLYEVSCRTVSYVDSWFGDKEDFDEQNFGGVFVFGADWDQYRGFDDSWRFRLRAELPNFSSRLSAFIGRDDQDRLVQDQQLSSPAFREAGVLNDPAWLLGLGYSRPDRGNSWWDWSVGARLKWPPSPYVRTRYHLDARVTESSNLRYRQAFFWREDRGFGTTYGLDVGQQAGRRNQFRWETIATWSESTLGVDWFSGVTWFRQLGDLSGLALLAFANGETDAFRDVYEYGFNLTYRRPLGRPTIWLNAGPTATWPRFEPDDEKELALGFFFRIEIEFGSWRRY